jgi:hypothetical protein
MMLRLAATPSAVLRGPSGTVLPARMCRSKTGNLPLGAQGPGAFHCYLGPMLPPSAHVPAVAVGELRDSHWTHRSQARQKSPAGAGQVLALGKTLATEHRSQPSVCARPLWHKQYIFVAFRTQMLQPRREH